jgi:hypothetical protein
VSACQDSPTQTRIPLQVWSRYGFQISRSFHVK